MRFGWIAVVLLCLGVGSCTCRPVCVPLSDEDVARFEHPIEAREDRDFYVAVFQKRDMK